MTWNRRATLAWTCILLTSLGSLQAESSHWAFRSPEPSPVPAGASNAIDGFILAKLQVKHLTPAPAADRHTLLRRAYFDLIGLPPTPEQVAAFVADPSATSQAFANVVDELLRSTHYGERWGRHWLDIARYGDSNGGDENHAYPNAYHYRNWVIQALNHDLPYDEFLRHQLAGDLLENPNDDSITATGFLALGTKILAEQDPIKKRADVIDEQIDTVSRAVMALTVACARCHDHKFDPVSQKEYYALAGIFHSTDIDNSKGLASDKEAADKATAQQELVPLRNSIVNAEADLAKSIDESSELLFEAEAFARGNVEIDHDNYGKGIGIISNPSSQLNYVEYDLTIKHDGQHLLLLRYAAQQERPGKILIDGKGIVNPALSKVTGGWCPDKQAWSLEGTALLTAGRHVLRIESEPMMSHIDKVKLSPVANGAAAKSALDRLTSLQKTLAETETIISREPTLKVMAVHDGAVANAKLNRRGNPHDLGAEVPRGPQHQIGQTNQQTITHSSGRRELAYWLTRPGHPLTSRVMVNRVWRWHFGGKGLVGSPDDFGTRGQKPTHPKLLDHLALDFERQGWSLKALHKAILLSDTWQRSTEHPDEAAMQAIDPGNTLYWKADARRLEAEAFRDAVIAVSGQLNRQPPHEAPPKVKSQDPSPQDLDANRKVYEDYPHRSVYLPIVRCHIYDFLTLLDFPNAAAPVGQRNETTVPTQALLMLNNPWLTQQAELLAKRIQGNVNKLYQTLYARDPSNDEILLADQFVKRYAAVKNQSSAWTALCQTLMISNEFLYVR